MPRPRSVLSPVIPRARKAKAEEPEEAPSWSPKPGEAHRLRVLEESPFGGFERPTYSDDEFELEIAADELREAGIRAVVEHRTRYGYTVTPHQVVTVADLAHDHLAQQATNGQGTWLISPEGQRRIYESMGL